MTQEALKLALDALEEAWYHVGTFQPTEKAIDLYDEARAAIKEALAQTQEPVAMWDGKYQIEFGNLSAYKHGEHSWIPLHTSPQRTWVGLTDEEENEYNYLGPDMHWVIQEIAAKLKEKNT